MKKFILFLIAFLSALCACGQECSTMWPYVYPEFRDAVLYKKDGTKFELKVNVHVLHGRLHYLDDGLVKEAFPHEVLLVQIGEDRYMDVNGDIMKVVASEDRGFVAGHINQNHMEMWEKRHNGDPLDLVSKYYLVTPGKTWLATRRGVEQELGPEEKAAFKAWLKSHKIKWNDSASLLGLLDFLVK